MALVYVENTVSQSSLVTYGFSSSFFYLINQVQPMACTVFLHPPHLLMDNL